MSFMNRHVPVSVVMARAIAGVTSSCEQKGDPILERMHEDGDMFFFMGQRGGWRYGFTDAHEIAEAEEHVKEYLPNMHVERYERDDADETLRIFLRGGGVREYPKDTVLVDCRGIPRYSNMVDKPVIGTERILNTFLTDLTDSHSAYTLTAMFLL